ncbi:hypothetical protein [Desulfonatronum parangueonense]
MIILCDTCSVLMLIRIAPEMFTDPKYKATTIPGVAKEIIRTQKFKSKYPWRKDYRECIKPSSESRFENQEYKMIFNITNELLRSGVTNNKNNKLFDLSFVDKQVVSFALAYRHAISTGDQGIVDFATQEFPEYFLGNVHPLDLINEWLTANLIEWDDVKHKILEEWTIVGERPQPEQAKISFQTKTGKDYPGP